MFACPCESCVEPVDIVGSEHLIGHIALIEVDVRPLSALRLVTGDGISELDLHSIVVLVLTNLPHAVGFQRNIGIVCHHIVEQLLVLLVCQSWCLCHQRVQDDHRIYLRLVIIGKLQGSIGETEAIKLTDIAHTTHDGTVTVGNEASVDSPERWLVRACWLPRIALSAFTFY